MSLASSADAAVLWRDASAVRGRLALSSGIADAEGSDSAWPRYADSALVPKPPWRQPSDAEWDALATAVDGHLTARSLPNSVAILCPPKSVIAALMDAGAAAMAQPAQSYQISRQPKSAEAIAEVSEFLTSMGADPASLRQLGFAAKPRGQATATVNTRKRRRAGLHLDRFDGCALQELSSARIRFCLNIGAGARHFLFCPHPVPQMEMLLGDNAPEDVGQIGKVFLRNHCDYPVVRVSVEPGEAYLAATEYLIHDATTSDISENWDLHIAFLCNFKSAGILQHCL